MAKKVTVINAISEGGLAQPQQRLKVCVYARVSTGTRAQAESYATQVEYYTEKIEGNPLWEFAGVYADEGITGTKVKGRDDFKAMIATCHKHVEDKESCHMKAIREDVLQQTFVTMWNKLYTNQGTVLEPLLKALTELAASKPDTEKQEKLDNEIHSLSEQSRILNQVMKKGYMDAALFMEKSNLLAHRLTECRRKKTLLVRRHKRTKEIVRTEKLIGLLKREGYQREFKEELFDMAVKEIRISMDHEISFCLKNGLVLTEKEGGSEDAVAYTNRL